MVVEMKKTRAINPVNRNIAVFEPEKFLNTKKMRIPDQISEMIFE
jgi:hypothetical protein